MTPLARILALAALAASAIVLPLPTVDADPCADAWALSRPVGEAAQDDAESGGDAGDASADAAPLPEENHSYSWGFVLPRAAPDTADVEDWFSIDLLGAGKAPVMAEVNATFTRTYLLDPAYEALAAPEPFRFILEAWPPGATEPLVGVPNARGGTRVDFHDDVAGTWRFRITYVPVGGESPVCAGVHPIPADPADSPLPATNYGVYFGCEPYCVKQGR